MHFSVLQRNSLKNNSANTGFVGGSNINTGFAKDPKNNSITAPKDVNNSKGARPLGF